MYSVYIAEQPISISPYRGVLGPSSKSESPSCSAASIHVSHLARCRPFQEIHGYAMLRCLFMTQRLIRSTNLDSKVLVQNSSQDFTSVGSLNIFES